MTTTQTITTPPTGATAPAATPAAEASRPAWLPEKFKSAEDMAKAYGELEKKLGTPAAPAATTPATTTEQKATETPAPAPAVEQTPEQKADFTKYTSEFAKDGKLSDQTYAEIAAKHGLSKTDVDNYISGQQAQAKLAADEVYAVAGGEQQFKSVITWASANMSAGEKEAYNKAAQSGDYATVKLAVAGMVAKFNAAYGQNPSLVGGRAPQNTGPKPYTSWAQVTDAMSDKRYAADESYRNEVQQRMAASSI